ncbi:hypothetical protein DAEQUDRAFT_726256 [Daedalea quercina L-15889]|uniref:DUF6534 domain-containing protein n=1 Tax=Daedalea quercina L-15889 TaxID=1314783 RepID=A0A165QLS1_9APHY|nr:hypothetical protein DAEQUDRAFT_726256 [Daedalea quercina L-15889]
MGDTARCGWLSKWQTISTRTGAQSPHALQAHSVLHSHPWCGLCVAFLYGITTGQSAFYWSRSGKDGKVLRCLVLLLWLLDSAHYVLVPCSFYVLLAESFHDGVARLEIQAISAALNTWSYQGVFVITGLTDLLVKGIFTYCIWRLSSSLVTATVLCLFSFTVFVLSCVSAFSGDCLGSSAPSCFYKAPVLGDINTSTATVIAMLTCVAISDITVAGTLCVLLWRRRTGFAGNERLMRLLMFYSIRVGLLTSLASAASLTTFILIESDSAAFIATFWVVPKLSINSLLALLNARRHLREEMGLSVERSAPHEPILSFADSGHHEIPPGQMWGHQTPRLLVKVETEIEMDGGPFRRDVVPVALQSHGATSSQIPDLGSAVTLTDISLERQVRKDISVGR